MFKDRTPKHRFPEAPTPAEEQGAELLDFPLPGSGESQEPSFDEISSAEPAEDEGETWVEEAPDDRRRGPAAWGPVVRRPGSAPASRSASSRGRLDSSPPPFARRGSLTDRRGEVSLPESSARPWLWAFLLLAFPLVGALGYYLNRAPPVLSLSRDLVDLGEVRVGAEGAGERIEVGNQGQETLRITQVLVEGGHASDFSLRGEACSGTELGEGASCVVEVAFQPVAVGDRRAHLELIGNATNSPLTLPLVGSGTAPRLRLEPDSVAFDDHTVGTVSTVRSLQLENTGSAAVELGRLELRGPGAADFVAGADDCSEKVLEAGGRCRIALTFVPTAAGLREASLQIGGRSEGPAESAMVQGRGLPQEPEVRLEPDRLEAGDVRVGEVSPALAVQVWNDGNGPLEIRSVRAAYARSLAGGASGSGSLEISRETCTRSRIEPAGSCRIEIRLAPVEVGEAQAFLEISHSAGEGLHRVAVTGRGVAPRAEISSQRLSFGEALVQTPGAARTVTLRSTGGWPLAVGELVLEGADARSFALGSSACSGSILEPGTECRIELLFMARREGPHRAELVIPHDASAEGSRVAINGIGVAARLRVDRPRLDFGEVEQGRAAAERLVLSNTGRALLRVRRVSIERASGSGFRLRTDRCSGTALEPGARCEVEVGLDTGIPGSFQARLLLEHDAAEGPKNVALHGFVREPPAPALAGLPGRLAFGTVDLGQRSTTRTLVLRNSGTGPLRLRRMWIEGAQALDFHALASGCAEGARIAPGDSCEVGLRFIPAGEGIRRAEWKLEHDAPGSPVTVRLEGNGGAPGS